VFGNLTAGAPGTVVYRVRQENWTVGGNEIGWFPSFPTYVKVFDPSALRAPSPALATPERTSAAPPVAARGDAGPATTASQVHGWGRTLWDFAWEFGESLTSRPFRGTDRTGKWLDTSNGTGRANRHNGGLSLDSQRGIDGQGDHGSTAVTLRGNPMTYGRWEAKLRLKSPENNTQDYRVRIELVPNRPADYHCGAQNITVADLAPHSPTMTVGAKALKGDREWTTRTRVGSLFTRSASFAVEVAKNHISWFLDSRVIGTVRNQAAVSGVPMTLRLSLVGQGQEEMNRTQAISDWQRGFSIQPGKQVTSGRALQSGTHSAGC